LAGVFLLAVAMDAETVIGIAESFRCLTRLQRRALSLQLQGYKQREIAAHMGLKQPAVSRLLDRAVSRLERSFREM
jgi:DNA-directed RNA polymerase specialized sigma24 family protein